eukprot:TRINITY_DN7031_c0_g5_i1.p1 TRINITY_DN7031_c0_g5~~TRINITY_DN7031_c0_g5_i1.p1  ORF type:complete len:138 (-),score=55.85 TRINITY_DN7031_c0_g5_i1:123-536(-)
MEEIEERDPFLGKISNESHKNKPKLDIKFYNYEPIDKSFAKFDPVYFQQVKNIERHYEKKINKLLKEYLVFDKDTMNLVPKKENADLKSLLNDKMSLLNNKYSRAIREIMIDNIKKQEASEKAAQSEDAEEKKNGTS